MIMQCFRPCCALVKSVNNTHGRLPSADCLSRARIANLKELVRFGAKRNVLLAITETSSMCGAAYGTVPASKAKVNGTDEASHFRASVALNAQV